MLHLQQIFPTSNEITLNFAEYSMGIFNDDLHYRQNKKFDKLVQGSKRMWSRQTNGLRIIKSDKMYVLRRIYTKFNEAE